MKVVEEGQKKDKKGSMFGESKTDTKITSTSFYRSSKQTKQIKEDDPATAMALKMFGSMDFYTTLNFAKKIKTIDVSTYQIVKQTDKSVILKYNLSEALNSKNSVTINIVLE